MKRPVIISCILRVDDDRRGLDCRQRRSAWPRNRIARRVEQVDAMLLRPKLATASLSECLKDFSSGV
jgi:hypothetical protein